MLIVAVCVFGTAYSIHQRTSNARARMPQKPRNEIKFTKNGMAEATAATAAHRII